MLIDFVIQYGVYEFSFVFFIFFIIGFGVKVVDYGIGFYISFYYIGVVVIGVVVVGIGVVVYGYYENKYVGFGYIGLYFYDIFGNYGVVSFFVFFILYNY